MSWKWLLLGLPAAGVLRFVDPRAAAVVALVTIFSVFLAVVFNSDPS